MNFLFVHGGPGLNSNPEKHLLLDSFSGTDVVRFWNEPSVPRENLSRPSSYSKTCESLITEILGFDGEKVTVIAHSFGAFLLNEILPEVENYLEKIILLTPVTDLAHLDKKLITASSLNSYDLQNYLKTFDDTISFNEERFLHLLTAASDPDLAGKYWHKKELMSSYFYYMQDEPFQFDLENFKAIRESCGKLKVIHETNVPTEVIYGAHDPFISSDDWSYVKSLYKNSSYHLFEESAHYCHIEEKELFEEIVQQAKFERHMMKDGLQLLEHE